MLTPRKVQELSDPIEDIYKHIVDELLVNIGNHITKPTWTHTASWEIQKLSELGQLTQENTAIINKWIKKIPPEMRETMEATRAAALDRLEKQMDAAAQAGYITPPVSDSTTQVLQDMSAQALDKYNLVNTTMLQSSLDQYARAIQLTEADLRRAEATQSILNETAASVASGAETRVQAVRRALKRISDEGLTGFVDKAGRSWSSEAYVNMVTRTTVHNTAIQATKARMEDFGTQVFQVSSHAGARPLCYPYQGKFYSWDNSAGEIELGNGKYVHYEPIAVTSYGEPAGLFGINCGHYPIVVVPGVTIPHGADNIQPKEENDKAYAESQEQRRLEREIREAKRIVEMEGDLATKEDQQRVKDLQAEMREFIQRTGRTRRYDRESIGDLPAVSRSQGGERERLETHYSNVVQERLLDAPGFVERFTGITGSRNADKAVYESAVEILKHRNGTNREDLYLIDANTGDVLHRLTTSRAYNRVVYDKATIDAINRAHEEGRRILAMHNHPGGLPPSLDDGSTALERGYDIGVVVGHNLEVWTYTPTTEIIPPAVSEDRHNKLNKVLQFFIDFDDTEWYDMLAESGMEVERK